MMEERAQWQAPPPLPPRHAKYAIPQLPLRHDPSAHVKDDQSLYICRVPGSHDVFLTENKIKSNVVTNYDVNAGKYLLHFDDPDDYAASLASYEPDTRPQETSIPRKSLNSLRPTSSRAHRSGSIGSNASSEGLSPTSGPRSSSSFKLEPIAAGELRNNSQLPLVGRSLVPRDAAPLSLIRLDHSGFEHTTVAKTLSVPEDPSNSIEIKNTLSKLTDETSRSTTIFIDVLDEEYDHYGVDINYIEPSNAKCFTRRMVKSPELFNNNWFLLSPAHGYFVFQSSILRDAIVCYHYLPKPPRVPMDEKVAVSRLTFNLVQAAPASPRKRRPTVATAAPFDDRHPPAASELNLSRTSLSPERGDVRHHFHDTETMKAELRQFRDSMQDSIKHNFARPPSDQTLMRAGSKHARPFSLQTIRKQLEHQRADAAGRLRGNSASSRSVDSAIDQWSSFDLTMGREKLGGGVSGDEAKLGKILVYEEGRQFSSLLVAANLALFNRAYQQTLRTIQ